LLKVIALWEGKSAPHPLVTLTQPLQPTGSIGRVRQKLYLLGTGPSRFARFHDKVKNKPGWTVHTLPCTTFMQLEMPDELTVILPAAGNSWEEGGRDGTGPAPRWVRLPDRRSSARALLPATRAP
jgi:hypothetical protein